MEQIPVGEKIIRTLAVYVLIIVLLRLTGKRGLAGLNTFDVVVVFLLSNVVQNAIIGNDQSLLGGIIGASTLVAANTCVNRVLVISPRAGRLLQGTASTVIRDGQLDNRMTRRLGLRRSEIEHAVRVQNGESITDVARGRLEPDGQLVLDLKDSQQSLTRSDLTVLLARLDHLEYLLAGRPDRPARLHNWGAELSIKARTLGGNRGGGWCGSGPGLPAVTTSKQPCGLTATYCKVVLSMCCPPLAGFDNRAHGGHTRGCLIEVMSSGRAWRSR